MAGIIDFPQVVQDALRNFDDLFANEPQRRHFAEYLTGLFVAARKTVTGINAEFARTTDQSCLNRFIHHEAWDVQALNQRRLDLLQQDADTRYAEYGTIAVDNTLIDHHGTCIEDVGWFWDHAEERYKIAHDYLIANYVCSSGKHYPLDFRCFQKQEQCEANQVPFKDIPSCSRSWSIGSPRNRCPAPSPWTAISPTPRFSTTSTASRWVTDGRAAMLVP